MHNDGRFGLSENSLEFACWKIEPDISIESGRARIALGYRTIHADHTVARTFEFTGDGLSDEPKGAGHQTSRFQR